MNDVAASVKELYDLIDKLVSKKPLLRQLSRIMADREKITNPKNRLPRVKSTGKN